jgi:AAA domain
MSDQPSYLDDPDYLASIEAEHAPEQPNNVISFPAPAIHRPSAFQTLAGFMADYVPVAYALEGVMRSGSVYTLTARTGTGKTAFNVILALAIATGEGRRLLGRDVEPGRVLYVALENPDDVRMRFMAACYLLNLDVHSIADRIVILDRRCKAEDILAMMKQEREPFRAVIVDTFAAHFDGKNVNDPIESSEFMRRYRPITQLPGRPTVLVSAHPTKNAGDDNLIPYGAGAILNEVDGNLTLARVAGGVSLSHQGKIRGADFEPVVFRFEFTTSPDVIDIKGVQISTPVLMPSTAEAVEQRREKYDRDGIALLKALADKPGASQRDLLTALGWSSSSTLNAALSRLTVEGLIRKVLGKNALTKKGTDTLKSAGMEIHVSAPNEVGAVDAVLECSKVGAEQQSGAPETPGKPAAPAAPE